MKALIIKTETNEKYIESIKNVERFLEKNS